MASASSGEPEQAAREIVQVSASRLEVRAGRIKVLSKQRRVICGDIDMAPHDKAIALWSAAMKVLLCFER
ncbi:hypothetical protein GCM10010990_18250 [Croceicoccus mobilis]|uniref:Uncharacterized protein n=1 Tax=Croceicoccus mobilis TaxID=1703339 RepID=A0A916Z095_9SPHN|nr:hypothetical protein GCM10010990_18250 [Croceicoccus mobilis]